MTKASSALGKLAAGKPKHYSKEELRLRTQRLLKAAAAARAKKKAGKS